MVVNRTTTRDTFADAYGVHVKDAYELVKMAKKPEHNELGKLKITERVIKYNNSDGNYYIASFTVINAPFEDSGSNVRCNLNSMGDMFYNLRSTLL